MVVHGCVRGGDGVVVMMIGAVAMVIGVVVSCYNDYVIFGCYNSFKDGWLQERVVVRMCGC